MTTAPRCSSSSRCTPTASSWGCSRARLDPPCADPQAKLALTSKIQDEVGHAQLLYRVAEDLGKPREAMLADLLAGKTKFHNVFHYPTRVMG